MKVSGYSISVSAKQAWAMFVGSIIGCIAGAVAGFAIAGDLAVAVSGLVMGASCGAGLGFVLLAPDPPSQNEIDFQLYIQQAIARRLLAAASGAVVGVLVGFTAVALAMAFSKEPPVLVWLLSTATIGAVTGAIVGKPCIIKN